MHKIEDFSKYRKELYNVAKNLTRSRFLDNNTVKSFYRKEIVDEILQNSFLIYYNRLNNNTIDNEKPLEKQLVNIVWRESQNSFVKKRYVSSSYEQYMDISLLPENLHPLINNNIIESIRSEEITNFINNLENKTIKDSLLLYIEGYNLAEISNKLNIKPRTVSKALTKGRNILKNSFKINNTKISGQK